MKMLLDTHALIWWTLTPEMLSERVSNLLADTNNELLLSLASVWEMQIKVQIGKLRLDLPLPGLIENQKLTNKLQILQIDLVHVWALEELPNYHKDPFDRIIIAQANVEGLPILSVDEMFDGYPVERLW